MERVRLGVLGAGNIADLNVAAVLLGALLVGYDTSPFPAATKWFEKCVSRDAHQRNRSRN